MKPLEPYYFNQNCLWNIGENVLTSTYLINKFPTKVLKNNAHYEILYNSSPSYYNKKIDNSLRSSPIFHDTNISMAITCVRRYTQLDVCMSMWILMKKRVPIDDLCTRYGECEDEAHAFDECGCALQAWQDIRLEWQF